MNIERIVQAAITERRVLLFTYEGDALPERVGHPHALYLSAASSPEAHVDVLQISGYANGDRLPAWRSFRIDKIVTAERMEVGFDPAPEWDPMSDRYEGGIVAMV
jgi:predicted DNA-binding transcriptional regulator YafY